MEMTIEDVRRLIAPDEHRTLEVKKTTGELKDGMHAACAFLNTDGGWLIFGIAPGSLKILGQEVTDATRREIAQAVAGLEPALDVSIEYVDVPEKPGFKVIAMCFDSWVWGKMPFTYHGCPYYKVESTTRRMPREMYEERLRAAKPQVFAWERQAADGIGLEDLDAGRLRGALILGVDKGRVVPSALTESFEMQLRKFKLLTKDGRPTNAAAFLFGKSTEFYPQFSMKMARFVGTTKLEFYDNMVVEGNFFKLLDAGTAFFFKHLNQSSKVVGFTREDKLEIPSAALREALTNSLCHRQWEKYKQSISIAIFDDRVEISNPGVLPPELPLEQLKLPHDSYPYNPIMASVLFQTTFLEKWGTGVGRMMDVCRDENVAEPEWTCENGVVTVTFWRQSDRAGDRVRQSKRQSNEVTNQVKCLSNVAECQVDRKNGNQVSDRVSDRVNDRVNDRVVDRVSYREESPFKIAILDFCMIGRTRREIFEYLNKKYHSDNFKRYIKPLLDTGYLAMTQPDKPNSPTQKYVTLRK